MLNIVAVVLTWRNNGISPMIQLWYCYQVLGTENVAGGQLATINTKI